MSSGMDNATFGKVDVLINLFLRVTEFLDNELRRERNSAKLVTMIPMMAIMSQGVISESLLGILICFSTQWNQSDPVIDAACSVSPE